MLMLDLDNINVVHLVDFGNYHANDHGRPQKEKPNYCNIGKYFECWTDLHMVMMSHVSKKKLQSNSPVDKLVVTAFPFEFDVSSTPSIVLFLSMNLKVKRSLLSSVFLIPLLKPRAQHQDIDRSSHHGFCDIIIIKFIFSYFIG